MYPCLLYTSITVYAGANTNLSIKHLKKYEYIFEKAKYCLISTEIPESIIEYTVGYCEENEIKIILKPTSKVKDEILNKIDYFVPNKKELFTLVPEGTTIEEKAEILRNKAVSYTHLSSSSFSGMQIISPRYAASAPPCPNTSRP